MGGLQCGIQGLAGGLAQLTKVASFKRKMEREEEEDKQRGRGNNSGGGAVSLGESTTGVGLAAAVMGASGQGHQLERRFGERKVSGMAGQMALAASKGQAAREANNRSHSCLQRHGGWLSGEEGDVHGKEEGKEKEETARNSGTVTASLARQTTKGWTCSRRGQW